MDRVERQVAINTVIEVAGRAATVLIAAGTLALTARYLSPAGFGRYQVALAYFTLFGAAVDLGLVTLLVRETSREPANEAPIVRAVVGLRLTAAGIALMAALGTALVLPYDTALRAAIAIASIGAVCSWMQGPLAAPFYSRRRPAPVVSAELIGRSAGLAAVGAVIALDGGLYGVVAANSLAALVTLAVVAIAVRAVVPVRPAIDGRLWRRLLTTSLPLGVAAALDIFYVRMDVFMLALFRPFQEVGLYSIAYRVYELLLLAPALFVRSVFPVLASDAVDELPTMKRRARRAAVAIVAIGVAATAIAIPLSPQIIRLAGGGRFDDAVMLLRLLLGAAVFSALNNLARHVIIAVDHAGRAVWLYAGGLTLNFAMNLALIPRYGATAAALSLVASEVAMLGGHLVLLRTLPFPAAPPTPSAGE